MLCRDGSCQTNSSYSTAQTIQWGYILCLIDILYLVPSAVAVVIGLVMLVIVLAHLKANAFKLMKGDKIRFVLLFTLVAIMFVSVATKLAGAIPSEQASRKDSAVGFLRLIIIIVRTSYLIVALVVAYKVFGKFPKNKVGASVPVGAVIANDIELSGIQPEQPPSEGPAGSGRDVSVQQGGQGGPDLELECLAQQLENPMVQQQ